MPQLMRSKTERLKLKLTGLSTMKESLHNVMDPEAGPQATDHSVVLLHCLRRFGSVRMAVILQDGSVSGEDTDVEKLQNEKTYDIDWLWTNESCQDHRDSIA
jgi:hypothetical protein